MNYTKKPDIFGPVAITTAVWILGILAVVIFWIMLEKCHYQSITTFYESKLRDPLFSGLLSLTGFLFALKAFILTNMKTSLYDRPAYEQLYRESITAYRKIHNGDKLPNKLKRYAGLDGLRCLLAFTLLVCLLSSILQLSVGLIEHWVASMACVIAAVNAIALLCLSVWNMQMNMKDLVSYWNSEYEMTPEERQSFDPNADTSALNDPTSTPPS